MAPLPPAATEEQLAAIGRDEAVIRPGVERLHRYSNLSWWMQRLPEPERPTLDALADCWFATS